jgi:uncharacterized protein
MASSIQDIPLIRATTRGDLKQVQALLTHGTLADTCDRTGTTPLMFAANLGYTEIARSLLDAGANINLPRKRYKLTALMLAASANQVDIVQLLVTRGADVNAINEDGSTALMAAALKGYIDVVKVLLAANADVNIADKDDDTALKVAVKQGHSKIVKILLQTQMSIPKMKKVKLC